MEVMENPVSQNQYAFLKSSLLVDEVIDLNKVTNLDKKFKKSCLNFKVDFEKAYNSVIWEILEYMLVRFGFNVT